MGYACICYCTIATRWSMCNICVMVDNVMYMGTLINSNKTWHVVICVVYNNNKQVRICSGQRTIVAIDDVWYTMQ